MQRLYLASTLRRDDIVDDRVVIVRAVKTALTSTSDERVVQGSCRLHQGGTSVRGAKWVPHGRGSLPAVVKKSPHFIGRRAVKARRVKQRPRPGFFFDEADVRATGLSRAQPVPTIHDDSIACVSAYGSIIYAFDSLPTATVADAPRSLKMSHGVASGPPPKPMDPVRSPTAAGGQRRSDGMIVQCQAPFTDVNRPQCTLFVRVVKGNQTGEPSPLFARSLVPLPAARLGNGGGAVTLTSPRGTLPLLERAGPSTGLTHQRR